MPHSDKSFIAHKKDRLRQTAGMLLWKLGAYLYPCSILDFSSIFFLMGFEYKFVCRWLGLVKEILPIRLTHWPQSVSTHWTDDWLASCVGWLAFIYFHAWTMKTSTSIAGDCLLHGSIGIGIDLPNLLAGPTSASHFHAKNQTSLSFTFGVIDIFRLENDMLLSEDKHQRTPLPDKGNTFQTSK